MRTLLLATTRSCAIALLLAACSDDGATPSNPTSEELRTPGEADGVQLAMAFPVDAGAEVHVCRRFVLPAGADLEVEKLEHGYSAGAHHIIAYREDIPAAEADDGYFDCGDIAGPFVYSEQSQRATSHYPDGVGMRFAGGQVVRVEIHFVNTTSERVDAEARLNLWWAQAPLEIEAGSLFLYDRDISIPAGGKWTARMHCEIPEDIELLYLLPHTHKLGTALRGWISGGDLDEPQLFLESNGYGDLHTRVLQAPVTVRAGQAIDFECDYENTSAETVVEGPSKDNNEMCLVLGGYYPRLDAAAEFCTMPGSGPLHAGTKTCGEALACTQGAADDIAAEACWLDVCEGSSRAINDFANCGFNSCPAVCPGPDCAACVVQACPDEMSACQAAACD
jgi:hypothetical protein